MVRSSVTGRLLGETVYESIRPSCIRLSDEIMTPFLCIAALHENEGRIIDPEGVATATGYDRLRIKLGTVFYRDI